MKKVITRMKMKIRRLLTTIKHTDVNTMLLAKLHVQRIRELKYIGSLHDVELKVFSQWGEDGIIQYLINNIPIQNKIFIEFGVEYYTQSNTRFLLVNDNWQGLVIDQGKKYIDYIHSNEVYWGYDLTALHSLITRENINGIFSSAGFQGDVGLLSIDIDGNDYWVWEAINVVNPRIVICEYNSVFGSDFAVTIPYDRNFQRRKAHFSDLYFGASLPALCFLAKKKGYDFIGSNSAGVNAFFVRSDLSHNLPKLTAKEGYVESRVRESRDKYGNYTYLSGSERLKVISNLEVFDVVSSKVMPLRAII